MTQEIRAELLPYDHSSEPQHELIGFIENDNETQLSFLAQVPHPDEERAELLLRGTIKI